ncbi:hypothetical protein MASR2M66_11260 [Chloroflexota bacterium]
MNFQPTKNIFTKRPSVLFYAVLVCITSLACSTETPTSPISFTRQSNPLPVNEGKAVSPLNIAKNDRQQKTGDAL